MNTWQPLETASKDGSKLDVWTENGVRYIDVLNSNSVFTHKH